MRNLRAMPDLGERSLCSEKIFVPPSFPSIMKGYCKAAIRTQPYDLLRWSAAYFRALANGENPPSKERLEFPIANIPQGLTAGYLKALVNLLGKSPSMEIKSEAVRVKWEALCLPSVDLQPLLQLAIGRGADDTCRFRWVNFLAVAAASISDNLAQTMILICETLTDDPEGGKAAISVDLFLDLYKFLAELNCGIDNEPCDGKNSDHAETHMHIPGIGPFIDQKQVDAVVEFMRLWSSRQDNMIMPRNVRHWMCPPLDASTFQS